MEKNKGYTLVEMVIVIAIMAILASLSMFSVGIIRDAKRSAAINTFDNQISSCLVKTKAVSDATNGLNKEVCMFIYRRTIGTKTNYCIKIGYSKGDGVQDFIKKDESGNGIILDSSHADNLNDDTNWDAVLPKDVTDIIDEDGNSITSKKIIFNKSNGSVKSGYGNYYFFKNATRDDAGVEFANIYLDKSTGNHYIK